MSLNYVLSYLSGSIYLKGGHCAFYFENKVYSSVNCMSLVVINGMECDVCRLQDKNIKVIVLQSDDNPSITCCKPMIFAQVPEIPMTYNIGGPFIIDFFAKHLLYIKSAHFDILMLRESNKMAFQLHTFAYNKSTQHHEISITPLKTLTDMSSKFV